MTITTVPFARRPASNHSDVAADRRRHVRFPVTLLGRFMRANKLEYPCKLIDISVGGASIAAPVAVAEGERIVAYFDHLGGLEGHVNRLFEGGFAFAIAATQHKREKLAAQIKELDEKYRPKTGRLVVHLVPVGEAVLRLRERVLQGKAPGIATQSSLFRDDLGHGKPPIYVLGAYCHFAVIYQRSPVGLPVPESLQKAGLGKDTEALNRVLQEVAWEAVTQDPLSGVKATPADTPGK